MPFTTGLNPEKIGTLEMEEAILHRPSLAHTQETGLNAKEHAAAEATAIAWCFPRPMHSSGVRRLCMLCRATTTTTLFVYVEIQATPQPNGVILSPIKFQSNDFFSLASVMTESPPYRVIMNRGLAKKETPAPFNTIKPSVLVQLPDSAADDEAF